MPGEPWRAYARGEGRHLFDEWIPFPFAMLSYRIALLGRE
jgi:hypothetical protein